MGKMDELIKRLCPEGVPMVTLDKVLSVATGKQLNKSAMICGAPYPVVNGGVEYSGYTEKFNSPANSITISQGGASAGYTQWINCDFWAGAHCYVVVPYDNIKKRYLFHVLKENEIRMMESKQGAGIPGLNRKAVYSLEIPLPPLAVQEEIVGILDTFTGMIDNLQKELDQRQKQFEYYRNVLLCFENGEAEVNELNKIAEYSKSRIEASDLNKANYVSVENLLQNKEGKVDSACCPTEGRWTKFMPGDILVGNIRPYLKKIWYADCEGGTNGDVLDIRVTSDKVSSKYLFKVLSSDNFFEYDTQSSAGAKMPRGKKDIIMKYHIPVPSLETQQEIVDKLDTFEALISNIKQEIELRQKQYEFYREKLLSFE